MNRARLACLALILGSFSAVAQNISFAARIELSKPGATRQADPSGAVLWLIPAPDGGEFSGAPKPARRQLLQKNKTFSPHLLVIPVGTAVDFPNQDPFFHNVFSLFEGKRFDLGLYESGSSRSVVFNRPGISYIFCNIHPEMSAVVVALTTPYYGISDRSGGIVIPAVPSGRYEMHIWHERVLPETLKSLTRFVTVSETTNSLVLKLTEQRNLSANHPNKYGKDYDPGNPNAPAYVKP